MPSQKKFALAIILILVVLGASFLFLWWQKQYPNYLVFQSSHSFSNAFYSLQVSNFIVSLWFADHDILAYYRAVTLEENYQGRWNLESFDSMTTDSDNETATTINTFSHLFTYTIRKYWTFYKNEPFFTVWINRTYLFDSENMNNQIIFDINNNHIVSSESWLIYDTQPGVFGYRIDYAVPDVASIQTGHPTESQINFHGAGDRDLWFHSRGEQEIISLTVYADQFGSVEEAESFLSR